MSFKGEKFGKSQFKFPRGEPPRPEWRPREIEDRFPEEFEGKKEEKILEQVLKKKSYTPLNKEELVEFHGLAYNPEINPGGILDYKNYEPHAISALPPLDERIDARTKERLQFRFQKLKDRWIEEMKELYGPYWLMNDFTYESLSKEGKQKLAKGVLKFWQEFYTGSEVDINAKLERRATLTDITISRMDFSELKEDERERIRKKIYRGAEKNKKKELNLIRNNLSSGDQEVAKKIMRLVVKRYADVF